MIQLQRRHLPPSPSTCVQDLAHRRQLKQQRRDVGLLRQLQGQLQGQAAEQAARLARRLARQAEKSLHFPPKLGRQKFQPLPTQVITAQGMSAAWLRTLARLLTLYQTDAGYL